MAHSWTWGLTEVLTGVTQCLTLVGLFIAGFGVRTFGKWQREKIEERRIEAALEAMSVAYESKAIFGRIRSLLVLDGEGTDIPPKPGESDEAKRQRRSFFAVLKRIKASDDYFARVWKLQPKFIAIFGEESEHIFDQLHSAKRNIEDAAWTLVYGDMPLDPSHPFYDKEELKKYRTTIFERRDRGTPDPVGDKLEDFRKRMNDLCRPVIDWAYRGSENPRWQFWR